jgi:hypothetical protein
MNGSSRKTRRSGSVENLDDHENHDVVGEGEQAEVAALALVGATTDMSALATFDHRDHRFHLGAAREEKGEEKGTRLEFTDGSACEDGREDGGWTASSAVWRSFAANRGCRTDYCDGRRGAALPIQHLSGAN